ncbi:sentrin-specific protease 7 [Geosmithia morbida]|uniref:Sentrin-specific protease 7 n=1 Tax=Geosmithia morbida TaxID=1094350 RepID=A0A9P4YT17_9HYPO|nr:sentrin-specific protease 7 [Geosmithia morbida]KAF4120479.1 sentrin-specific protease 7 [Geosmithia morbida]
MGLREAKWVGKGLNTSGRPLNTFSPRSSASGSRAQAAVAVPEPPRKRSRRDSSPSNGGVPPEYVTSRFFPGSPRTRPPPAYEAGTPDDPYELRSTTSNASNGNNHRASPATASLPEYRQAQPRISSSARRKRRRRNRQLQPHIVPGDVVDLSSTGHQRSETPDSPDVLAREGDDGSPSPSPYRRLDTTPGRAPVRKRAQPSPPSEPHVKRSKPSLPPREPIDISEDELQAMSRPDAPPSGVVPKKRKTNFSGLLQSPKKTAGRSRGDMQVTDFVSPSKRSPIEPANDGQRKSLSLIGAVSGSYTWFREQSGEEARLLPRRISQRESGSTDADVFDLAILNADGETVEDPPTTRRSRLWLQISTAKIQSVRYAADSPYVSIQRSSSPSAPPTLTLRFASVEEAHGFTEVMPHRMLRVSPPSAPAGAERAVPSTKIAAEIPFKGVDGDGEKTGLGESGKVKDRMLRIYDAIDVSRQAKSASSPSDPPPLRTYGNRETRRSGRPSPGPVAAETARSREPWTASNPSWMDGWHQSLVYPATGKNRATVDAADIPRLDDGEFLNDNIISFYLRYLQVQSEKERPGLLSRVHIFSSFFFEKLKASTRNRYDGVRSWTAKIDLLSYDYIVVPVNENAHWYLAVICNVSRALPGAQDGGSPERSKDGAAAEANLPAVEERVRRISIGSGSLTTPVRATRAADTNSPPPRTPTPSRQYSSSSSSRPRPPRRSTGGGEPDAKEPKIITLDSLGSAHPSTCRILREYLAEEAKDKKGVELAFSPSGMTAKGIPEQDNFCDCGVFVLGYMEELMRDPDAACAKLLRREPLGWDVNPVRLRARIRDLLFDLQREQKERHDMEKAERKRAKREKREKTEKTRTPSAATSAAASPAASAAPAPAAAAVTSSDEQTSADKTASLPYDTEQPETGDGETEEDNGHVTSHHRHHHQQQQQQQQGRGRQDVETRESPRAVDRIGDEDTSSKKDDQSWVDSEHLHDAKTTTSHDQGPTTLKSRATSPEWMDTPPPPLPAAPTTRHSPTTAAPAPAPTTFVERIPSSASEDDGESSRGHRTRKTSDEITARQTRPVVQSIEINDDDDGDDAGSKSAAVTPRQARSRPQHRHSVSASFSRRLRKPDVIVDVDAPPDVDTDMEVKMGVDPTRRKPEYHGIERFRDEDQI